MKGLHFIFVSVLASLAVVTVTGKELEDEQVDRKLHARLAPSPPIATAPSGLIFTVTITVAATTSATVTTNPVSGGESISTTMPSSTSKGLSTSSTALEPDHNSVSSAPLVTATASISASASTSSSASETSSVNDTMSTAAAEALTPLAVAEGVGILAAVVVGFAAVL